MSQADSARDRKLQILAAAHLFTQEMESLGIKYATVIYDETLQTDEGMRIYTIGNMRQDLIDWLLETYASMRKRSEIVEIARVRFDDQQIPA
jgi:hypothetical protein